MRGMMVALLSASLAGSASADDCGPVRDAYRALKTLPTAEAYIECLEKGADASLGGLPAAEAVTTPTFGAIAPGNPNGMEIEDYLRLIKQLGGYSDYDWTRIMAGTFSSNEPMALVYDKDRLAPELREAQPFELKTPAQQGVSQYFVDQSTFNELSQFALEGGGQ